MLVRAAVKELISSDRIKLRLNPVASLELVQHELQQKGQISASAVYDHLKTTGRLIDCLSQRDGEEIQSLTSYEFRKIFGRDASLLLWRSYSCCENPDPKVPILGVFKDTSTREVVKIRFVKMDCQIGKHHLTPRIFRG